MKFEIGIPFVLFWLSWIILGQHTELEDPLSSMITDLHKTYSAKYQLMDADFVRRETRDRENFGKKMDMIIGQIEKKYESKLAEQERKFNALEEKYEKKFSNMVSEYESKHLEQKRKSSSLMSRMLASKMEQQIKHEPKQREY